MTVTATPGGRVASATRPSWPRTKRRLLVWAMLTPALLGLLVFFVYPLVANVYYSLTSYDLLSPPRWIGFRNYEYLFTKDPRVVTATINTLWFVVILVPVRIVAALTVAWLLVRAKRGSGFWRTLFYLPALVPPVASVVAFVFLFNPGTGPVNLFLKFFGIRGPLWFNDPALSRSSSVLLGVWVMGDIMIIFLAALLDVPQDQYEAASLDGANGAQKAWYVTIPTIVPVLVFAVVTGIISALQYFTEAAVASAVASGSAGVTTTNPGSVLGYPGDSLLTYTQWLYVRGFSNFQLGYASALAVLLFIVASVLVGVLLRKVKAFTPEDAS